MLKLLALVIKNGELYPTILPGLFKLVGLFKFVTALLAY